MPRRCGTRPARPSPPASSTSTATRTRRCCAPASARRELCRGLTTIVNGNCGLSAAPFGGAHGDAIRDYLRPITGAIPPELVTDTLAGYFACLPALPVNVGMLVSSRRAPGGRGRVRAGASGGRALPRPAPAAGAGAGRRRAGRVAGSGLRPECFYTTRELIRALAPIAGQNIPLTVHMRQEGGGVCQSVEEMLPCGAGAAHPPCTSAI